MSNTLRGKELGFVRIGRLRLAITDLINWCDQHPKKHKEVREKLRQILIRS